MKNTTHRFYAILGLVVTSCIMSHTFAAHCPDGYYMDGSICRSNLNYSITAQPIADPKVGPCADGGIGCGGGSCSKYAKDGATYDKCQECKSKGGADEACTASFACESIFTDHVSATKCNYDRCLKTRAADYCNCKYGINGEGGVGIPMNTDIPFVGNCIGKTEKSSGADASMSAFPVIISAISRMLVTVILLVGFIMIVVGGVQWASGDAKSGKDKITKVAIGFALLGMMGAILRFINPNFFKKPDIR